MRPSMDLEIHGNVPIQDAELKGLLQTYRFGRYLEDTSLPKEGSRQFILDGVKNAFAKEDAQWFSAHSADGTLVGLMACRKSSWDTEHFGYPVLVIDSLFVHDVDYEKKRQIAKRLIQQCRMWSDGVGIRFISFRLPQLDLPVIHALEDEGFHYIESWIWNKYDLRKIDLSQGPPLVLRAARPEEQDTMIRFSKRAFDTQRFHADPYIAPGKAESFYLKWITTSFSDPNQKILALDMDHKPVAFMIYYHSDQRRYFNLQFAMWKMALLDPESRRHGVGTDFFMSVLHHHRIEGMDICDSGLSMRNTASLALHNKLNFKILATYVTYHLWIK